MEPEYDVIIIGGGSAGCAAAMRLSADPRRRVLLLEAGPDPQPLPDLVADAALQTRLLLESPYLALYPTTRPADGSTFYSLAGRIMGGGSSVNAMAAPRPLRHDLDGWAALGNSGWSYDDLLPILRRMEADQQFPTDPIHGATGPLHVDRPFALTDPAAEPVRAFIDRALALGLPACPDINGPNPLGVCASAYSIKEGRRQSATVAYLDPVRDRPNLRVEAEATVARLELRGGRVEGVVYRRGGVTHTARGGRVVLAAGVFHSPQLLMLSGIGPPAALGALGVPVAHPLPGVGENYQDHAVVIMTFEAPMAFTEEWVVPRFRLITKSDPALPCGDFHIFMRQPTEVAGIRRTISISAHLLEQRNRGRLMLPSTDPDDIPLVDARMLEHPDDLAAIVTTMRFIADLVGDPAMRRYFGPLLQPGPGVEFAAFARTTHDSYHHGVGTCKMGPATDPLAVVDPTLRVHGIENLWVADASVMPTVPHANTNLSAIMAGERVADILGALG